MKGGKNGKGLHSKKKGKIKEEEEKKVRFGSNFREEKNEDKENKKGSEDRKEEGSKI